MLKPPLEPPDSLRLRAASGWLELGCPRDALVELEELSTENREHPDVLELSWLIHAECQDWPRALAAAERLVNVAPERPTGWLHRAYAMRRVPAGGLEKAWDLLLPAFERFPGEGLVAYNLACYACRMGRLEESRKWLQRALSTGRKETVKAMALKDEDLHELWDELQSL